MSRGLMTAQLLVVTLPTFCIGALLLALGSRHTRADAKRARWLKFSVFFVIVHVVLAAAIAGTPWIASVTLAVALLGAAELARAWSRMSQPRPVGVWVIYIVVTVLAVENAFALSSGALAFLFVVAASFDGFSQVFGQWLGRIPLAPRISPAKTFEGVVGGLFGATVIAIALHSVLDTPVWRAVAWGLAISGAALAGDLSKSWVKRRAGIKNFAETLPGHGGFLDRFDSFLAASGLVGLAMRAAA
jgi:phosphatidate cytidylyltransferase